MQIRVITLRYSEGLEGFSEDAVWKATFGRDVLAVETHFFTYGNVPHLLLVISLGDERKESPGSVRGRGSTANDPEASIPEERRPLWRALRHWRNETAVRLGIPAYAVARNVQLAEIVKAVPHSLSALREIEGCGEGFCEKYGKELLGLLESAEFTKAESSEASSETTGESGEGKETPQ